MYELSTLFDKCKPTITWEKSAEITERINNKFVVIYLERRWLRAHRRSIVNLHPSFVFTAHQEKEYFPTPH